MESQLEKQIYLSENKKAERSKVLNYKFWKKCRLKKSKSEMGFEPITLPDLVRCSNQLHVATGDSMVSKSQINTCCCYFSIFSGTKKKEKNS